MDTKSALKVMRALEVGLRVAIDQLEHEDDPLLGLVGLGVSSPAHARTIVETQVEILTRQEIEEALAEFDPYFAPDGRHSLRSMRNKLVEFKMASLKKAMTPASRDFEDAGSGKSEFSPPGVTSDSRAISAGGQLQMMFDSWTKQESQRHKTKLWAQHMNCDTRCVRPGGACPQALSCAPLLSVVP